ncbi:5,10-methylene-tetrahydrofolate dehydrogenase/methenyltetrahydrofolate cyclohydrolase [Cenarchaeum symbiosum A]|uniref:Bifunctional protein FolD n=1 Tax=Cenarchaeum symbiosum (strain A) TaxID=414004 RepID=FOLD_CENSY|nr:RecName: Full=Bifunctional protein FolD; Includes: RecName: Full=Methylenetetrahydrofolate dehydrogenase; Includes: RecName: Full=Methenyltetrahydrofolate cyclohydrolase [Cenarchaeum symbiosum A]ABK76760.1 5,10-methylene-tetrahydrofolate dehydrogenase/methenyltetrahydrofolate cyclohydrolase [Cenarchaeum symbiosum A]
MDGKAVAAAVKERVKMAVAELKSGGTDPCLATVLVGDDPASGTYVRNKHAACAEVGITTQDHRLGPSTTEGDLLKLIAELNSDRSVHGILVQMPLPEGIREIKVVSAISPLKDVDGLTPLNAGLLTAGTATLIPCTPLGIMEMLDYYNIELEGKEVVLINRSRLVGIPLHHLFLGRNATVTTCHSRTKDIGSISRRADVIVTAVGNRDKFVLTPDMVKEGAVVIDVAISRSDRGLTGDADYAAVSEKASHITPVPGGVGPMTVAMLLKNTTTAASLVKSLER